MIVNCPALGTNITPSIMSNEIWALTLMLSCQNIWGLCENRKTLTNEDIVFELVRGPVLGFITSFHWPSLKVSGYEGFRLALGQLSPFAIATVQIEIGKTRSFSKTRTRDWGRTAQNLSVSNSFSLGDSGNLTFVPSWIVRRFFSSPPFPLAADHCVNTLASRRDKTIKNERREGKQNLLKSSSLPDLSPYSGDRAKAKIAPRQPNDLVPRRYQLQAMYKQKTLAVFCL